jgi:hypothetical protein
MSGHFLKPHFCMFERSQGRHKIWIIIKVIGIFSLFANFKCLKVDTNRKCFYMFKAFKF